LSQAPLGLARFLARCCRLTEKTRLKSRPAVAADLERFYGRPSPYSVRARVLEMDGEVVGVAGYYLIGGAALMFSDSKADLPKMTIWREAKAMMATMKLPAICVATETSGPFLERLGWARIGGYEANEVYSWQG